MSARQIPQIPFEIFIKGSWKPSRLSEVKRGMFFREQRYRSCVYEAAADFHEDEDGGSVSIARTVLPSEEAA